MITHAANDRRLLQLPAAPPYHAVGAERSRIGCIGFLSRAIQSIGDLPKAIKSCPDLAKMSVELDGGPGTELSHWDEETFGAELMTGYKNSAEHVLPVTIEVTEVLGHTIKKNLAGKTKLNPLLKQCAKVVFSERKKVGARQIDRDFFVETEPFETIPHRPRR